MNWTILESWYYIKSYLDKSFIIIVLVSCYSISWYTCLYSRLRFIYLCLLLPNTEYLPNQGLLSE